MGYNLKLLKEFSLQSRVIHEVAKVLWGDFYSRYPYDVSTTKGLEIAKLIAHRQNVFNRLSEIDFDLPEVLRNKLSRAVLNLQRGYDEAFVCTEITYTVRRILVPLNPLVTGPYSAKNFIDPSGCFNELFWAKSFCCDENVSIYSRFEIACFYCFVDLIHDLWCSFTVSGRHPYDGTLYDTWNRFNYLVALWVQTLGNELDKFTERSYDFAPGFYMSGFKYAKGTSNEFALRFFWCGCSDTEKATWLSEVDEMDYEDISNMAFMDQPGCLSFIYSHLSLDHKRGLFSHYNFGEHQEYVVWTCLLTSPFYECVLHEIVDFLFPVSSTTFTLLLERLSSKMRELPIADYEEIFEALWNCLQQDMQSVVLDWEPDVVRNLTKAKAIGPLRTIIQPLHPVKKEWILLEDWQLGGISALDEFSKAGDYDALHRYLLLFLTDLDPVTQRVSMRSDAQNFFDSFVKGEQFIRWTEGEIPEYERKGVAKVIDSFQGSFQVLSSLLEQVEEMHGSENESVGNED